MTWIDNGHKVYSRMQSSRMQVRCPYKPEFVLQAVKMGGKWRARTSMWSFSREKFPHVSKVLNEVFDTNIGGRRKGAKT